MAPPLPALGFLALFGLVGAGLVLGGAVDLIVGYRIRTGGTNDLLDATAGGPVALEGTVRVHEQTYEAPFTGTECVGFEYEVEEYERDHDPDGGSHGHWDTIDSGTAMAPFLLDGEDGTILVQPDGADLDVGDDTNRFTVSPGDTVPEGVRRFVERSEDVGSGSIDLDVGITEITVGSRRRYTERLLLAGETAYVSGVARGRTTATVDLPNDASAVIGAPATGGRIARLRRRLAGRPFLISDAPAQEAGTRKLKRGALLAVFGGVFLAVTAFVGASVLGA